MFKRKFKGYPATKKRIRTTSWGKELSKDSIKLFKKLGKLGNKAFYEVQEMSPISQELWDKFRKKCYYERRWCEKLDHFIKVYHMRLEMFNKCPKMLLNGGVCDPI